MIDLDEINWELNVLSLLNYDFGGALNSKY
jgi:hypothetical protein